MSERKKLTLVLVLTALYFVTELVGGVMTNSLALLSDAAHMLTDVAAICLSLLTLWIASRPASGGKTYGYLRAEILGALLNGLFLWLVVVFIVFEAVRRIRDPKPVAGLGVMLIAGGGLVINSLSALVTRAAPPSGNRGMAMRAAFLHVLSDLVGSLGVLLAGTVIYFSAWTPIDPLVSIFISALVVVASWSLVREGVDILMEATPAHIDLDALRRDLLAVAGTEELHDLHVWSLTTRELALSAHAVVEAGADPDRVLHDMSQLLEHKFSIRHMTVQLERDSRREREPGHF